MKYDFKSRDSFLFIYFRGGVKWRLPKKADNKIVLNSRM